MDCNDIDAIDQIVARLHGELTSPTAAEETGLRLASHASAEASAEEVEQVPLQISSELKQFWRQCRKAELFRDVDYDQWGLDIVAPLEAIEITREVADSRPNDLYRTDLVDGRFRGDSDMLIIRCDADEADFGAIVIALPLDRRSDWYFTSMCLADFLREFIETRGRKFWEVHA